MNNIREKINGGVKYIYIFRNGPETSNGHTTPECLQNIMSEGLPGITTINVLHYGSNSAAIGETNLALAVWIIRNGGRVNNYLSEDKRLKDSTISALFEKKHL